MKIVNSKKLVLGRESRGLTQHQLVAMIPNLNQGNYSKMEKGLLNVPTETLSNISKALNYPIDFFYKKSVNTPISSFYYRKRVSMPKKQLELLEARLDVLRLIVDDLLDAVELPEFAMPALDGEVLSPSEVAVRIRDFLKLPKGPVKNLVQVLESAGIIIYFIQADTTKFDGITLLTDKGQPIIFINAAMPNDRKVYTIAHELGHLVMHVRFSPLAADRDFEAEANEFAGEFLMPYLDCRYDLVDLRFTKLSMLKVFWGVSKAAIVRRAHELSAITPERYRNLNIELGKSGEKKNESGYVEIGEPVLLNLIINAYENELGYSLTEILSMLSIATEDYFRYFSKSKHQPIVRTKRIIELPGVATG